MPRLRHIQSVYRDGSPHREDFRNTVENHRSGKREANEKPKPLMQLSVILPVAVENCQTTVAAVAIISRQKAVTKPNLPSPVWLLPPKKTDRGAFTWKIWVAV